MPDFVVDLDLCISAPGAYVPSYRLRRLLMTATMLPQ
jgi:hypothetical protein